MKIIQYWEIKLTMFLRVTESYFVMFCFMDVNFVLWIFTEKCIEMHLFPHAFFTLEQFLCFLKSLTAVYGVEHFCQHSLLSIGLHRSSLSLCTVNSLNLQLPAEAEWWKK